MPRRCPATRLFAMVTVVVAASALATPVRAAVGDKVLEGFVGATRGMRAIQFPEERPVHIRRAVAGATVAIGPLDAPLLQTLTDADGRFRLEGIEASDDESARVSVWREGYCGMSTDGIADRLNEGRRFITITINRVETSRSGRTSFSRR